MRWFLDNIVRAKGRRMTAAEIYVRWFIVKSLNGLLVLERNIAFMVFVIIIHAIALAINVKLWIEKW